MLTQVHSIARNTFVESIRQPVFFVLVMLAGILQVLNTWSAGFTLGMTDSSEVSGDNKLLFDVGLATVFVFGTLLAAFVATAVVSREIENKTVLTVVSKPVARASVILGKYLGVAGAILLAVAIMLLSLLLGLRHGVMSTAADFLDGPVIIFGLSATVIALFIAVWCNYFYGWYFSQTCMLVLLPGLLLAYLLVLLFSKKWQLQSISADLKPQVLIACAAMTMALLVLTAVATAVSTRLGQVMTIVVCAGVFMLGLLSNYLFGRRAFLNTPAAVIKSAVPENELKPTFDQPGLGYVVTFDGPSKTTWKPGASFYYGPSPNGFPMWLPAFPPFAGNPSEDRDLHSGPGAVIVSSVEPGRVTVRNIGETPCRIVRPPKAGDYVFTEATHVNPVMMAIWGAVPNMQYFWLVDAVSQNQRVPPGHLTLIGVYAAGQIGTFLALGVALFQRRDVG